MQPAAQQLEQDLRTRPESSAGDLVAFAHRFAADPKIKNEALILKLRLSRVRDPKNREQLQSDMLSLLHRIVHDQTHEEVQQAERNRETLSERRQQFLQAGRPSEVVCAGTGLTMDYGPKGFTLGPVWLTLREGEITGLVGQNAHGKTTLLEIVSGCLRQTGGTLTYPALEGQDAKSRDWVKLKNRIAYVPQVLPPWRGSLLENLHFHAAAHGVRGRENSQEVEYIVERLGLSEHLGQRWKALSGGYRLRFSLAAALVWKPRLLVLDEPLANLDVIAQTSLLRDLRALANSMSDPLSVILSSQHLHELEAVCDNLLFLRRGTLIYSGPLSQLGDSRINNVFELGTPLTLHELREQLDIELVHDVSFNGVSFVLKTRRDVRADQLLTTMLQRGIYVRYFRDISRSVKQLFE